MNTDELNDDTFHSLAGIARSARYHDRRRGFYENWNSVTSALSALALAAGSVRIYQSSEIWSYVLGFGAVWCAIDVALGIARKAVTHSELSVRFVLLEKRFSLGKSLSDEEAREVRDQRLEIESREPPLLYLLNELCQRSYERSIGVTHDSVKLPLWRRCLVYFSSQEEFTKKAFNLTNVNQNC